MFFGSAILRDVQTRNGAELSRHISSGLMLIYSIKLHEATSCALYKNLSEIFRLRKFPRFGADPEPKNSKSALFIIDVTKSDRFVYMSVLRRLFTFYQPQDPANCNSSRNNQVSSV